VGTKGAVGVEAMRGVWDVQQYVQHVWQYVQQCVWGVWQ
jgi:hypothetical protein